MDNGIVENTTRRLYCTISKDSFIKSMPPLFNGERWKDQKTLQAYIKHSHDIFTLINGEKKSILELGCGFGLMLVTFGLFGARRLIGVDIAQESQAGFEKLSCNFPDLDLSFQLGDWLDLPKLQQSVDVVFLHDSISHIRDTETLLSSIFWVLKKDGFLFICDDNNDLSIPAKLISRRKWKHAETATVESSKFSRSVDKLSYTEARAKMIKEAFPILAPDVINDLANKTRGLFGQEIIDYVAAYQVGRSLPQPSFSYRNPLTGEFHEKSFNPQTLNCQLQSLGFDSEVLRPVFPITPLKTNLRDIGIHFIGRPMSLLARTLPLSVVPYITPNFWIRARKRK